MDKNSKIGILTTMIITISILGIVNYMQFHVGSTLTNSLLFVNVNGNFHLIYTQDNFRNDVLKEIQGELERYMFNPSLYRQFKEQCESSGGNYELSFKILDNGKLSIQQNCEDGYNFNKKEESV